MRHRYIIFFFQLLFITLSNRLIAQDVSMNRLSEGNDDLNFVYDMRVSNDGKLLIATDHSLFQFDGFNYKKVNLQHDLTAPFVTSIEQGDKSELIGHYKGFVSHVSAESSLSVNVKGKVAGIVSIADKHFVFKQDGDCLELDKDYQLVKTKTLKENLIIYEVALFGEEIFMATSNGLLIFSINQNNELQLLKTLSKDSKVESIAVSKERLLAVINNRIVVISRESGEERLLDLSLLKGKIKSIVSKDHRLVIGTSVGVYDYFLNGDKTFISGAKESHLDEAFPITKLYLSPDGTVYVGTYGLGLWAIPSPTYYYLSNKELGNRKISSVHLFEGNMFVVGGQNGLSFYLNGALVNDYFPSAINLENKVITVISTHPEGLVIGTESHGVWLLDTTREIKQIVSNVRSIEDIVSDSSGNLWISTSFEGLYTFSNQKVSHFSKRSNFSRNDLTKLKLVEDRLWFINGDDGFGYVNLKDSNLVIPTNLPPVKVMDFEVTEDHEVWATTQGDGIMNYNENGYSFINLADVIGNNFANTLIIDTTYTIWLTNQNTLLRWNENDRLSASTLDLYFESTFRTAANYFLKESNWVYYGTEEGLVYFDASQEYNVSQNSFNYAVNGKLYKELGDSIQLSYKDQFKISFSYADLVRNPFLEFSYIIKGGQEGWIPIEGNQFVLNGIGYGIFDIQVRASSKEGVVYNLNHIHLDISKPFWLQLWFYVLIFLFLASAVYLYTRIKVRQLRRRNIELTRLVTLRTIEITQKNKKLEQFAYAVSHDLKNPVINIIGLVEILEQMDLFKEDQSKQVFDMLGTSSRQLDRLVKGLMELLKAQKDENTITTNSISEIFTEVKQAISLQISESDAEISTDFSNANDINFNRTYLYSIIYNLTSNAVKYRDPSRPLKIDISTAIDGDFLIFKIKDNGLGMDLHNSDGHLFKMFQRFHDHVEGTGVGLHLINEMVESAGGHIDVDSEVGVGSTFTVYLKQMGIK